MSIVRATLVNGLFVPKGPVEWPEGTEVDITPAGKGDQVGIREEDWPTTPEGIAALLAKMDEVQPFLTPDEEAEWKRDLAEQKAYDLSKQADRDAKIRGLFE